MTEVPLKGSYALHDFARTAALFAIPYTHPARFPISTVGAARAMIWIGQNAGESKAREFAHRVYRAYFAEGQDIGKLEVIKNLANETGIDSTLLADAIQREDIKTALRNQVETAMEKGVFGSPFIFVDGEPFWGFDRFELHKEVAARKQHLLCWTKMTEYTVTPIANKIKKETTMKQSTSPSQGKTPCMRRIYRPDRLVVGAGRDVSRSFHNAGGALSTGRHDRHFGPHAGRCHAKTAQADYCR